jgi:hypothetical protein
MSRDQLSRLGVEFAVTDELVAAEYGGAARTGNQRGAALEPTNTSGE